MSKQQQIFLFLWKLFICTTCKRTRPFNFAIRRAAVQSRGTTEVDMKPEGRVEDLTLWGGRCLHGIERECLCLCREKTNSCSIAIYCLKGEQSLTLDNGTVEKPFNAVNGN